jgi:LacI family transcriptional regulator
MDPRRPTSADVAALAGVSRTTVSFVLNGRDTSISPATRERVLQAARQLGYHAHAPARQLAGGRSHTLGLVVRQSPEQIAGDGLLAETLRGLTSAARSGGFRVIVEAIDGDDTSYGDLLRTGRVDGLIVSGPRSDDPDLRAVIREGFPVVLQGSLPGLRVPSVDIDNVAGARHAVEHLVAEGHRRIGCITNAPLAYTAAHERAEGWRAVMREAGLPASDDWLEEGGFDAPSGHRALKALLSRVPDIEAVFIASDVVALGAIGALRSLGRRVPADLSVVGFDDVPLAAFFDPPLTTVHLPAYQLGHAAGVALLDRISEPTVPGRTLLPTELVVRASTRASRSPMSARLGH